MRPRPVSCLDGHCGALDCPRCYPGINPAAEDLAAEVKRTTAHLRRHLDSIDLAADLHRAGHPIGDEAVRAVELARDVLDAVGEIVACAAAERQAA